MQPSKTSALVYVVSLSSKAFSNPLVIGALVGFEFDSALVHELT
jgi:hypothetical protein